LSHWTDANIHLNGCDSQAGVVDLYALCAAMNRRG